MWLLLQISHHQENPKWTVHRRNCRTSHQRRTVAIRSTRGHYLGQWATIWLSKLQAVRQGLGFPAHNFQPKIPKVRRVHWTPSSDCQKHSQQSWEIWKRPHHGNALFKIYPYWLPSPAELLHQQKLKSNLPIRIENQLPNRDQISKRLIERQQSMKYYHDRNAQDLSPLATGQHVRIQDQHTKKWFPGTVSCKRPEPRSYEVETQNGSTLWYNRCHLRLAGAQHIKMGPTDENTVSEAHPSVPESAEALHTTPTPCPPSGATAASVRPAQASMETIRSNANQSPEPYRTRSGRTVTSPARFAE